MNLNKESCNLQPWSVQSSELIIDNRWAKVRRDKCELPDGSIVPDYYYWVGGDFAQVFAVTTSNKVILTRQYKHGAREIVLELPAGLIDPADSTPLAAAQRELSEETGYVGSEWTDLGVLNVSSAKATTRAYLFFTRRAVKTSDPKLEPHEAIELSLASIEEILELISRGEIRDSSSIAATLLALRVIGYLK